MFPTSIESFFTRPIMFAGLRQEYRRVFGDQSATSAAPSAPIMPSATSPFVVPANRRDDHAVSAKDENAPRDRCDTPPVIKKARLYTEDESRAVGQKLAVQTRNQFRETSETHIRKPISADQNGLQVHRHRNR